MMITLRHALVPLLAIAAICPARPAAGQDALGAGDALDANLSTRGRQNAPATQLDLRARNLLITGNVAGGRGFRGSVGYTADRDFRGAVGSDASYSFRAGSALSSPGLLTMSGQAYQRLRFGQDLGAIEFRRDSTAMAPSAMGNSYTAAADLLDYRVQLDRNNQSRSTQRLLGEHAERELVGYAVDPQNRPWYIDASPLRGLSISPMGSDPRQLGLTTYDMIRLREDAGDQPVLDRLGVPFQTDFQRLGDIDNRVDGGRSETNMTRQVQPPQTRFENSQYIEILRDVASRIAKQRGQELDLESTSLQSLNRQYAAMRNVISNPAPPPVATATGNDMETDPTTGEDPTVAPQRPGRIGEAPEPTITLEQLAGVLKHDQLIESLTSEQQSRFNELVGMGEERLTEGEYYRAEQRFVHALRFIPGHPLAAAGLGHAQLGAGNYLSAGLTLRSLLVHQPEMLDTRYSTKLLPNEARLSHAVDRLRELSNRGSDTSLYAFLLAYIGHQTEKDALVREGLGAMEQANKDDPLLPLLRHVWLSGGEI